MTDPNETTNDESGVPFTEAERDAAAEEVLRIVERVLDVGAQESSRPSFVLAGLRAAAVAQRDLLVQDKLLSPEQLERVESWIEEFSEIVRPGVAAKLARRALRRRSSMGGSSEAGLQAAVNAAGRCAAFLAEFVTGPVGMMLILTLARRMCLAKLKTECQGAEYERQLDELRALENMFGEPVAVELPHGQTLSRGGDA